jgi:hypothetical protein
VHRERDRDEVGHDQPAQALLAESDRLHRDGEGGDVRLHALELLGGGLAELADPPLAWMPR